MGIVCQRLHAILHDVQTLGAERGSRARIACFPQIFSLNARTNPP